MPLEAKQTPPFERQFKRLHRNEQESIAEIIAGLRIQPPRDWEHHLNGTRKCCNSVEISKIAGNFRLMISVVGKQNLLRLIAIGPHRTIYDETGRYLASTGLLEACTRKETNLETPKPKSEETSS